MNRLLKEGDIVVSRKFPTNEKYVVAQTLLTGGGTGHGPHDVYPDGHKVILLQLNNQEESFYIYQTGSFHHQVMVEPGDIKLVEHREKLCINLSSIAKAKSLPEYHRKNEETETYYIAQCEINITNAISICRNIKFQNNSLEYMNVEWEERHKKGTKFKQEEEVINFLIYLLENKEDIKPELTSNSKKHKIRSIEFDIKKIEDRTISFHNQLTICYD